MENATNESLTREDFLQYQVGDYIWIYFSPCLIILGTFGNTLSIIVLLRKALRSSTTMFYLTALSFGDILSLYTGLLRYWISKAFDEDIRRYSDAACKLHTFFVYSVLDFTAWVLVAVTIDRCLSVSIPFKTKRICSLRKSRLYLSLIIVIIFGKNLHFFWQVELVQTWEFRCDGATEAAEQFMRFVWPWIDFCTFCLLPFTIMIGCNSKIIYEMVTSQRKLKANNGLHDLKVRHRRISQESEANSPSVMSIPASSQIIADTNPVRTTCKVTHSSSGNRRISNLTAMLLTVNCVFLVTTSPIQAFLIGEEHWFEERTAEDNAWYNFWWAIVNMLQYLNNAIHFMLYCLTGPRFRHELRVLFSRNARVAHFSERSHTK